METLAIYLSASLIIFLSLIIFKREKIKNRRTKNQTIIIIKYAVYSLIFAIVIPIIILAPEMLASASVPVMSGEGDSVSNSEYSKTENYDNDMIVIGVIILFVLGFLGVIMLLGS